MPCPLCDDTGWKPIDDATASAASSAATAGATRSGSSRLADANIPKRYQHCTLDNFTAYNESLEQAADQGAAHRRVVSGGRPGAAARRAARRRQDAPGGGRPEAGRSRRRRARAVLRHARSPARHPQHLRPVDPHHRARDSPAGDDRRSARARRSRRGEDVRVGRRDDEPDRQHAVQRAAADDLHLELPGHPRRHRSELAAVPHRPSDAVAAARDVRVRGRWTAPTTASCRSTAASTI